MASDGVKFHEGLHKLKNVLCALQFNTYIKQHFANQNLCLLVFWYSLWICSKYLKCQKVANVIRWCGPMALLEKLKTASGANQFPGRLKNYPYYCPGRGANPRPPAHPTRSAIGRRISIKPTYLQMLLRKW